LSIDGAIRGRGQARLGTTATAEVLGVGLVCGAGADCIEVEAPWAELGTGYARSPRRDLDAAVAWLLKLSSLLIFLFLFLFILSFISDF
jgi:hypothetical protein